MKVVAVGGKAFVTGFVLSGVSGEYVSTPSAALDRIQALAKDPTVGLIMVSDEVAKPISDQLTTLRSRMGFPLIYEVPGPGSKKVKV